MGVPRLPRRGFVLVLMTGILSLLLFLTVSLLSVARSGSLQAGVVAAEALGRLASQSGLEYAASRLAPDYPRYARTVESRGDDWTFREEITEDLARAANPSFSHGEAWADRLAHRTDGADNDADGDADDPREGDGAYHAGDLRGRDLDADGAFSAWSGRVRGAAGPMGSRFSLCVESTEGMIPVNAGVLSETNLYGTYAPSARPPFDRANAPFTPPDHRDVALPYHNGLAQALSSLGVVCRLSHRTYAVPTGEPLGSGEPIRLSWLGWDLMSGRPAGGWKGRGEIEAALASLGYSRRDLLRVRPFIDTGPYEPLAESSRFVDVDPESFPAYAPITLATAHRNVLRSLWMYMNGEMRELQGTGEMGGWLQDCTRTGPRNGPRTLAFNDLRFSAAPPSPSPFSLMLYPDEAERLADHAIALREAGWLSWEVLFRRFSANAMTIFAKDAVDICGDANLDGLPDDADLDGVPDAYPWHVLHWTQAKAELAYRIVSMDPYPYTEICHGMTSWASLSVDRNPAWPGVQVVNPVGFDAIGRVIWPSPEGSPPDPAAPWGTWPPGRASFKPFFIPPATCRVWPQGLTMAPPVLFRVASVCRLPGGGEALSEARLRLAERLDFTSQEDFERLAGGTRLAARGIEVRTRDPEPWARLQLRDDFPEEVAPGDASRTYQRVTTLPRWSRRSFAPEAQWQERVSAPGQNPLLGVSRCYGAIAPVPRPAGVQGAGIYWPLVQDCDGLPNDGRSEGVPNQPLDLCYADSPPDASATSPYGIRLANSARIPFPFAAALPYFGNGTLECWMAPGSWLDLFGADPLKPGKGGRLTLSLARDASDHLGSTTFSIRRDWTMDYVNPLNPRKSIEIGRVSADDPVGADLGAALGYHVALTIETDAIAKRTAYRLYVNGRDATAMFGPVLLSAMDGVPVYHLSVVGAGSPRVYPFVLDPDAVMRRTRLERYVRMGTYTSPRYVLDAPFRILKAAWHGIVPADLYLASDPADAAESDPALDAAGRPIPLDPFTVEVIGCDGPAGDDATTLGDRIPTIRDDSTKVYDLSAKGPFRSFRFRVMFDCWAAAGRLGGEPAPLRDPPVFESLWLVFQRQGQVPRWHAWSSR